MVLPDCEFDIYVPAIESWNVKYDFPALNVDTSSIGDLNNNKDKLSLPSNMPPSVGEVKKEMINVEIPDTSTQIKSEPITAKVEEPVLESNELLSLKKVDASGNLIAKREKQKEEIASCND